MGLDGATLLFFGLVAATALAMALELVFRMRPSTSIFVVVRKLVTLSLVVSTIFLLDASFRFAGTDQSTPNGPLRLVVQPTWQQVTPEERDEIQGTFHESGAALADYAARALPASWKSVNSTSATYNNVTQLRSEKNAIGTISSTVPAREITHRASFWVPKMLKLTCIVLALFLLRQALAGSVKHGPFHLSVIRRLQVIAVIGLASPFVIHVVQSRLLDSYYNTLHLMEKGFLLMREPDVSFNWWWLLVLVAIEVFRQGHRLQKEVDATV